MVFAKLCRDSVESEFLQIFDVHMINIDRAKIQIFFEMNLSLRLRYAF